MWRDVYIIFKKFASISELLNLEVEKGIFFQNH